MRYLIAAALSLALVWPTQTDAIMFSNKGAAPQPGFICLFQGGNITLYQSGLLQCFAC